MYLYIYVYICVYICIHNYQSDTLAELAGTKSPVRNLRGEDGIDYKKRNWVITYTYIQIYICVLLDITIWSYLVYIYIIINGYKFVRHFLFHGFF
jgi:hypothetical protein